LLHHEQRTLGLVYRRIAFIHLRHIRHDALCRTARSTRARVRRHRIVTQL
jgi:hypothetical protein